MKLKSEGWDEKGSFTSEYEVPEDYLLLPHRERRRIPKIINKIYDQETPST